MRRPRPLDRARRQQRGDPIDALLERTPRAAALRHVVPARSAPWSPAGPLRPAERVGVVVLLAWVLVGPRIELPGLPGLRVEDFAFALLAAICVRAAIAGRGLPRPAAPSVAVAAVAGTGVLAAVVAIACGTVPAVPSLLYAVRPLEYWIVFPAVGLLLRSGTRVWRRRIDLLLAVTTVLQAAFAAAQYFLSWDVGFSHAAYTRAAGLTVGPYELGAIGAALAVYWLGRRRVVLAAVAAVALVVSVSRISLLGAALGVAVLAVTALVGRMRTGRPVLAPLVDRVAASDRKRLVRLAAVAGAGALGLGLVLGFSTSPLGGAIVQRATAPITERLATTSVLGSWTESAELAQHVPPSRTAAEYQDVAYARLQQYVQTDSVDRAGSEASNLVRFFRWHVILNSIDDPREVLLGLGPSFVGPSVDGSYLRFLADAGVLGLVAWTALIVTWLRRSPAWMVSVTVTMLVGAVFIDIVYAQRPMALYWTLLALARPGGPSAARGARHRDAPLLGGPLRARTGRRRAQPAGAGAA